MLNGTLDAGGKFSPYQDTAVASWAGGLVQHYQHYLLSTLLTDTSDLEDEGESVCCRGCDEEKEECKCQKIIDAFHKLNKQL